MAQVKSHVVHVAESFGGGVAAAILDYVRQTPEHSHHLIYATRSDAPVERAVLEEFTSSREFSSRRIIRRVRQVRRMLQMVGKCVVHAHSSMAGAYVRLAVLAPRVPIVYTPHCFAFERTDATWLSRRVFYVIEKLLARNTTAYAACSARERELATHLSATAHAVEIPNIPPEIGANVMDLERRELLDRRSGASAICIAGAGRLSAQKDPAFFRDAFLRVKTDWPGARAIWVGDGPKHFRKMMEEAGVEVLGWKRRVEALRTLTRADLYLHTAAWEGFPIAVLEMMKLGMPVIVREIPAFESLRGAVWQVDTPNGISDAVRSVFSSQTDQDWKNRYTPTLNFYSAHVQQSRLRALYAFAFAEKK